MKLSWLSQTPEVPSLIKWQVRTQRPCSVTARLSAGAPCAPIRPVHLGTGCRRAPSSCPSPCLLLCPHRQGHPHGGGRGPDGPRETLVFAPLSKWLLQPARLPGCWHSYWGLFLVDFKEMGQKDRLGGGGEVQGPESRSQRWPSALASVSLPGTRG